LGRVMDRGLAADERLVRFVAEVSDRSGGIHDLTTVLKEAGASVKDVFHERAWLQSSVDRVQIKFIIETTGHNHTLEVKQALLDSGITLLVYQNDVLVGNKLQRELDTSTNTGPAEPAPFE